MIGGTLQTQKIRPGWLKMVASLNCWDSMLLPSIYPISNQSPKLQIFLWNNFKVHDSLFHFPSFFAFSRPSLPHTSVIFACINHLTILMSSYNFGSVIILWIRFIVSSLLSSMDMVESLYEQPFQCMGYWLHSGTYMD